MSTELVPSSQAGALITGIPGFTVPVTIADHDDKAAEQLLAHETDEAFVSPVACRGLSGLRTRSTDHSAMCP